MKILVSCIEGLEAVTGQELQELIGMKAERHMPGLLVGEVKKREDVALFALQTRSALRVLLLLDAFVFTSLDNLVEQVGNVKLKGVMDGSFVVRCERKGTHKFNANDVERRCGEVIIEKTKLRVDLHHPKYTLALMIINQECFAGIDYVGFKLSKREYRVKVVASSLNPCVAYSLLRIAEWKSKEVFLDPFCKTGEIPIEACLFALNILPFAHAKEKFLFARFLDVDVQAELKEENVQILAYDALHVNVRNAEVNAKLALVRKHITFSRTEVEWLDTKLEKASIDKVITALPLPSRFNQYKDFEGLCKEFFYVMEFVLKPGGKIVVWTGKPEVVTKEASVHQIKKEGEWRVRIGTNDSWILRLGKEDF